MQYLCLFVTIWVAIEAVLDRPVPLHVSDIDDPPSFNISFPKVENADVTDPVIGYKVKVIQVQKIKKVVHKIDSETQESKRIVVEKYPRIDANKVPAGNYTELIAAPADRPSVIFPGVVQEVAYEIIVRAFTKKQEGPTSAPIRIKVNSSK